MTFPLSVRISVQVVGADERSASPGDDAAACFNRRSHVLLRNRGLV